MLRLLAAWAATRPAPPLADLHADSQPEQHATPILLPILRTSASLARHVLLHAHPTRVTLDSSSAHAIPRLLPMHASHLALTLKGPFPDDDDGGHAFAAALAEGVAHLLAHASRLELSGAALTPALLAALGQRTSERLQELALVDCALPEQLDDGSAAAAAAGDAGAAAVGAAVPAAPPPFGGSSLERLVVRRCHVGPPEQAPWGMSVRKPPLRAVRVATALVPAAQLRTLDTDAWVVRSLEGGEGGREGGPGAGRARCVADAAPDAAQRAARAAARGRAVAHAGAASMHSLQVSCRRRGRLEALCRRREEDLPLPGR